MATDRTRRPIATSVRDQRLSTADSHLKTEKIRVLVSTSG